MTETQETVSKWADETFGQARSNLRIACRANEEMAELLRELSMDDHSQKALDECADIVIVLYRVVQQLGGDLQELIDAKMRINRARKWALDGSGQGQHIREKETK